MDRTKNNQPHQLIGLSLIRQWRNSMNTNNQDKSFLKKIVRRTLIALLGLVLVLAVVAGGGYGWALMSTDTSLAARGIIWGGSRFDDWKRFPSRVVRASNTPVTFAAEETDLFNDFSIDGQPLETYIEGTNTTAFIVLHENASVQPK